MGKKKVLIVDDETESREFTKRYLERIGFEAVAAESGLLGLKLLNRKGFDVLISDINMPQMDGLEFTKKAKLLNPYLVIILLTGYGALKTAQEAIKIGIHDYLTKPIELEKLKISIQEGIRRITEKKKDFEYYQRLEDELKGNREKLDGMKNELITLISHELRTPVTVVTSAFDLLKETMEMPSPERMQTFTEDQKKRLFANIEKGHRRLITIIEDLNYYLSLAKGEVSFVKETVDLNSFLNSNLEVFKHLITEYNADLRIELSGESLRLQICKEKILGVLERLIHNAAYHNPAGTQITLRSSVEKKNIDGKEVRVAKLEICDNGKGIEKSLLEHIFSPFSISDIDHHSKGLGMGLCICKRVIELHGASIRLDSPEDKGTKVVVEFLGEVA